MLLLNNKIITKGDKHILPVCGGSCLGANKVVNGTFDVDVSSWLPLYSGSILWNNGQADVTVVLYQGAYQNITGLTIGSTYLVTGVATNDLTTARVYIGTINNPGSSPVLNLRDIDGAFSGAFVARTETHGLGLSSSDGSGVSTWDNLMIREIPGI